MKFEWNDKYNVGVKIFDEQHKHFLELANQIFTLAEAVPPDREKITQAISDFGNYALYHLSSEEEYFEKYDYPDKETHKTAHDNYRQEVGKFLGKATSENENDIATAEGLADFAVDWLLKHILGVDQQYADFFKAQGIE